MLFQQIISYFAVIELAERLNVLVPPDVLMQELSDFTLAPASELPPFVYGETFLDQYWFDVADMSLPTGRKRFVNLSEVALTALSLPHSNAEAERCFSLVRKIQTDYRTHLTNNSLQSLLSVNINRSCSCYEVKVSPDLLRKAKKSCVTYNEKLCKLAGSDCRKDI